MSDSSKKAGGSRAGATTAAGSRQGGNGGGAGAAVPETAFSGPTPGPEKRTVSGVLGEVTWLMTQSARHKTFFLSDLEWLVMAPMLLKQFRLFYGTDRPIGVALWAFVDEEVEARLAQGNARLRPQDWKCGDRLWVVDIIAPFGGEDEMLKDLKASVFRDRTFKYLGLEDGRATVKEV